MGMRRINSGCFSLANTAGQSSGLNLLADPDLRDRPNIDQRLNVKIG